MRYDLEADWHLLDTCNYRCSYCFYSPETLGRKLRVFATPAQWSSALDQTGLTWLLHLTGGEPSIYPDFAEFCAALTQKHYVSFNTNLASHAIANLAQQVDPSRVSFVNAGFHTKERDLRNGQALFLRNAELLRAKGFPLIVSIVATPDALACFSEAVALLRPIGLYPVPKLLRGHFEGRLYPEAYSATDKARFRFVAVAARELLSGIPERTDRTAEHRHVQRRSLRGGTATFSRQALPRRI